MTRTQLPAWKALAKHKEQLANFRLTEAFTKNDDRASTFSFEAAGIFADFSKNLITQETIDLLINLAAACNVTKAMQQFRQGEKINATENRAVLHPLLRASKAPSSELNSDVTDVQAVKQRMRVLSEDIINGKLRSATNQAFTDVVHIGIGGSYLGPSMIYEALKPNHTANIRCHFVANICANEIFDTLNTLNPETTLFIIASKTFTTLETCQNAQTAKNWLIEKLPSNAIHKHFFGVTTDLQKALDWGIPKDHILTFSEWVGGRFSTFSSIGFVLNIGLGADTFDALLQGAEAMDTHFFTAPFEKNLPVWLALIGIWYVNFFNKSNLCIAPYDHRLRHLPAYLQQLEMESNGKGVDKNGHPLSYNTCPVIFGEPGTNCQHSYFQLLHQSPAFIPVDFILCFDQPYKDKTHHQWLIANALAQSQALMVGQHPGTSEPFYEHKTIPGNRPSTTLALNTLNAESLGALIALYEHKVFIQGVVWDVYSFDQWGVELGKQISKKIHPQLASTGNLSNQDSSTRQIIQRLKEA
ncbi:MAG: glucose-6-phosphate isomerase [Cellvibrionales bacterium]|nr:glucose-6-phosphate isomerase [Cellvibrionales bacterium]